MVQVEVLPASSETVYVKIVGVPAENKVVSGEIVMFATLPQSSVAVGASGRKVAVQPAGAAFNTVSVGQVTVLKTVA